MRIRLFMYVKRSHTIQYNVSKIFRARRHWNTEMLGIFFENRD